MQRIESIDAAGPRLNAIIEVNPDAAAMARTLDERLAAGGPVGPLHGIPVVLKANIDTGDRMATSAGSMALARHRAADDARLVGRLREAGAVILAKANLSEWANFRSTRSISGWSSLGGQTRNAYVLDRNPCGSSSGSAVAVAARLAPLAVGTETDGSIVCPAAQNGVVGIKPTLGLIEQDGIIPIAASQDTAGPMARTVADAALLLAVIASPATRRDFADVAAEPRGLAGRRIGVLRDYRGAGERPDVEAAFSTALSRLAEAGATLVDPIRLEVPQSARDAELVVLLHEFKAGLNRYLADAGLSPATLDALIDYNDENAGAVMPFFDQELFRAAAATGDLESDPYLDARAASGPYMRSVLDETFAEHGLDALIAPTNGPAWKTDVVYGDRYAVGSSSYAAVSGYPSITVPSALVAGLPFGVSLIAQAFREPLLLEIAAAYEQAAGGLPAPRFLSTLEPD